MCSLAGYSRPISHPSTSTRSRRLSDADDEWFKNYRPDKGYTTTIIKHDPEEAAAVAVEQACEQAQEGEKMGVQQKVSGIVCRTECVVSYDVVSADGQPVDGGGGEHQVSE